MSTLAESIIPVINAFEALLNAIKEAQEHIKQDQSLCAWAQCDVFSDIDPRAMVIKAIGQIEYFADQSRKEVFICPGLIGASEQTLACIEQLNLAKDEFKSSVQQLKKAKIPLKHPDLQNGIHKLLNKRNIRTQIMLEHIGFARLHLKQCYRKLPILKQRPDRISWTWANTRSIKKITIAQAEEMLLKKGDDDGIRGQLRRLAALSSQEELAIVQDLAPHLRTNLVFVNGESDVSRQMLKGPMPLFFPADETTALPYFKPPKAKQARNEERVIRSDTKLDPTPYLPAIRAHRYT